MDNLVPKEKKLIKEIEEIREIIYGYKNDDPEWQREIRPQQLTIERNELIRNFIISHHLLTEENLNNRLIKFFIKYKCRSKRYIFFEESVLRNLNYYEKNDLSKKLNLISQDTHQLLVILNNLRNKCSHHCFLNDRKIKLLYRNKDLLKMNNFKEFVGDIFNLHQDLWDF